MDDEYADEILRVTHAGEGDPECLATTTPRHCWHGMPNWTTGNCK
jgi:hypothetical protein